MLQISVPTLLLDEDKAKRNISRMVRKATDSGCSFRPHFKTHQSVELGSWFQAHGINKIAVSSLRMAEKFAIAGWKDILVAIPVNINEIDRINALAERIRLGLTVECDLPVAMLARGLKQAVDLYIEIDSGYPRTGIDWEDHDSIDRTLDRIKKTELIKFAGFLVHAGHTYANSKGDQQNNRDRILSIHQEQLDRLSILKNRYQSRFPDLVISYGDTPSCTLASSFEPISEIRPGNFIFYDLTMEQMGVCEVKDIAVAMACPVIGVNSRRNEVAVYGGSVHFSKEALKEGNRLIFGKMVQGFSRGWGDLIPDAQMISLSQEHGIVRIDNPIAFRRIGIGDILTFLPVHSCLTVSAMQEYRCLDGRKISL